MTTLPHRKPGSASKKSSNNNQPLANENLVQRLMWIKKQVGNADIIQVRIVPDPLQIKDEGETKKQATVVVSLTQAIQQALAANKDLVEISIDQDVPVVTIAKVSSIVYHNAKSAKKVGSNSSSSAASILKEVTMQPGIAGGDLQRKVNDILNFIDKGHSCTVTVRAGRRWTRDNENIVHESLERVMALLFHVEKEKEECRVEMAVPPEINEQKSMGKFQVRRVSKRK